MALLFSVHRGAMTNVPMENFPEHDEAFLLLEVSRDTIADARDSYSFLTDRLERYE